MASSNDSGRPPSTGTSASGACRCTGEADDDPFHVDGPAPGSARERAEPGGKDSGHERTGHEGSPTASRVETDGTQPLRLLT